MKFPVSEWDEDDGTTASLEIVVNRSRTLNLCTIGKCTAQWSAKTLLKFAVRKNSADAVEVIWERLDLLRTSAAQLIADGTFCQQLTNLAVVNADVTVLTLLFKYTLLTCRCLYQGTRFDTLELADSASETVKAWLSDHAGRYVS